MRSRHFRAAVVSLSVLVSATIAGAQEAVSSLADLRILSTTNSKVIVTDDKDQSFRGTVADATPASLSLKIGKTVRQFAAADIRVVRVQKEDSLANGALIGAGVGGGLAGLAIAATDCSEYAAACVIGTVFYSGLGALIGMGIDAAVHRKVTVYTAARPTAQRITIAPFVTPTRTGMRLTVAF